MSITNGKYFSAQVTCISGVLGRMCTAADLARQPRSTLSDLKALVIAVSRLNSACCSKERRIRWHSPVQLCSEPSSGLLELRALSIKEIIRIHYEILHLLKKLYKLLIISYERHT